MSSSHINPLSTFQPYKPFGAGFKMFQCKVVHNHDPSLLGRIKCNIPDLMPWDDEEKLPWIFPLYPVGLGEGPLTSQFNVPEKDSNVIVISPECSIYKMFYVWHKTDRLNRLQDFHSEYPERYGFIDSKENKHITNKDKDVNNIEVRWSDGTLTIQDSKDSINHILDFFGTFIKIDRKNQELELKYGDLRLNFYKDKIEIFCPEIIIRNTKGVILQSKTGVTVKAPEISIIGEICNPPSSMPIPEGN